MIERYPQGNLTWYDVQNPTTKEIRFLISEIGIPIAYAEDLTTMSYRTETVYAKGLVKSTLTFPIVKRTDIDHPHEVKFIATKNALVTIRFEDIEAIDKWKKDIEVVSLLKRRGGKTTGGHLLSALLLRMYKGLDTKLDYLNNRLLDVEKEIFLEREKEMVFEISFIGRRIIGFSHALASHESTLDQLYGAMSAAFGKTYLGEISPILEQYLYLKRRAGRLQQLLDELRATNNALLTTKQNEIVKILTIMAFITFPLTVFTSMFGMNTSAAPIIGHPFDFWIILGIMIFVSVGFFGFFKYKRWM